MIDRVDTFDCVSVDFRNTAIAADRKLESPTVETESAACGLPDNPSSRYLSLAAMTSHAKPTSHWRRRVMTSPSVWSVPPYEMRVKRMDPFDM